MNTPTIKKARRRKAEVVVLHPCAFCQKPSTRFSEVMNGEREIVELPLCTKHHDENLQAWQTRKKILDMLRVMDVHPCVIDAMMSAHLEASLEHGLP